MSLRLLLIALCVGGVSAGAHAAVPAELAQRIADAAQQGRASVQRETEYALRSGDPAIIQMMAARAREQASAALGAIVIAGVAENPMLADEIMANARAAAPELAADVSRRVTDAYPYLGAQVAQATAPQPSSRPVEPALSPHPVVEPPSGPPPATDALPEQIYDPLEGMNRGIFAFNDVFDRFVVRPIAWTYGKVMPERAKTSVRNFLRNLSSPVRFANDGMQGTFGDAGNTLMRFLINSTVGVGGLFEVADDWGFPYKPSDFGTTLHTYGVQGGPYLVIPFFGPSNMRDATGLVVDSALNPLVWFTDTTVNGAVLGTRVIATREQLMEVLDQLRADSLDFYAALRSAYYQDRARELRKGAPAPDQDLDKQFDEAQ